MGYYEAVEALQLPPSRSYWGLQNWHVGYTLGGREHASHFGEVAKEFIPWSWNIQQKNEIMRLFYIYENYLFYTCESMFEYEDSTRCKIMDIKMKGDHWNFKLMD